MIDKAIISLDSNTRRGVSPLKDEAIEKLYNDIANEIKRRNIVLLMPYPNGLHRGELACVSTLVGSTDESLDGLVITRTKPDTSKGVVSVKVIKRRSPSKTESPMYEVRRDIVRRKDQESLSKALEDFGNKP